MDDPLKLILKKLDEIDNRLKKLETSKRITSEVKSQTAADKTASSVSQHDPLFAKAVEIMEKYDEISASTLQQALKIDKARAEKLLDELEAAGYGTCYWKEV
ncbi:MAG: DNA translocase FtsK [Microgenomates group bacterium]